MNTSTSPLEAEPKSAARQHKGRPDHKSSETMMPLSEIQYRSIVEKANQAVMIVQEGLLRYVNPKAGDLFGYPQHELLSQPTSTFLRMKLGGALQGRNVARHIYESSEEARQAPETKI